MVGKLFERRKFFFKSAKNDIENLILNLSHIIEKLNKHEFITRDDWDNCFELYNESKVYGALFKVTKE